jgi:Tfp pilus assembly protein PilV
MRTTLRSAARRRGIGLVEVMIAFTILTIAILGSLAAHISCVRLAESARETQIATADARSALEEILLLPSDQIPSSYPADQELDAFHELHLEQESVAVHYPGYDGVGEVPDPLEVRVEIRWLDAAGRLRSLDLASLRAR